MVRPHRTLRKQMWPPETLGVATRIKKWVTNPLFRLGASLPEMLSIEIIESMPRVVTPNHTEWTWGVTITYVKALGTINFRKYFIL
jgi:hypothetical protein